MNTLVNLQTENFSYELIFQVIICLYEISSRFHRFHILLKFICKETKMCVFFIILYLVNSNNPVSTLFCNVKVSLWARLPFN